MPFRIYVRAMHFIALTIFTAVFIFKVFFGAFPIFSILFESAFDLCVAIAIAIAIA